MGINVQQEKQIQVFGYGFPVLMLFLAWRHTTRHQWDGLSLTLVVIAGCMLLIALFCRPVLVWIFHRWMKVAQMIGFIVTTIILSIVFLLIFTPISLVLRLMNKDYMGVGGCVTNTYWKQYQSDRLVKQMMKDQY